MPDKRPSGHHVLTVLLVFDFCYTIPICWGQTPPWAMGFHFLVSLKREMTWRGSQEAMNTGKIRIVRPMPHRPYPPTRQRAAPSAMPPAR